MLRPFTRLFKTGHAGFLLFTLHCCAAAGMDSRPSDVQPGAVCLLFQLSEALCMHATPFHTRIGEIRWEGEGWGGVLGGVNGQPKPTTYRQNLDVVALVLQIAGEILQSRLDLRGKVQRQRE